MYTIQTKLYLIIKEIYFRQEKENVSDNTKQNSAQKGININIKVCAHFNNTICV